MTNSISSPAPRPQVRPSQFRTTLTEVGGMVIVAIDYKDVGVLAKSVDAEGLPLYEAAAWGNQGFKYLGKFDFQYQAVQSIRSSITGF